MLIFLRVGTGMVHIHFRNSLDGVPITASVAIELFAPCETTLFRRGLSKTLMAWIYSHPSMWGWVPI
jgi:threonine/homoserine efflux transporter RhtA